MGPVQLKDDVCTACIGRSVVQGPLKTVNRVQKPCNGRSYTILGKCILVTVASYICMVVQDLPEHAVHMFLDVLQSHGSKAYSKDSIL